MEGLPGAGHKTKIEIRHKAYFSIKKQIGANNDWKKNLGDLKLAKYSWISGQLIDPQGRPLAGQTIYVMPADIDHKDTSKVASLIRRPGKGFGNAGKIWKIKTDDKGQFATFRRKGARKHEFPPMNHAAKYRIVYGNLDKNTQIVKVDTGEEKKVSLKR